MKSFKSDILSDIPLVSFRLLIIYIIMPVGNLEEKIGEPATLKTLFMSLRMDHPAFGYPIFKDMYDKPLPRHNKLLKEILTSNKKVSVQIGDTIQTL